jgi:signal peptidase II
MSFLGLILGGALGNLYDRLRLGEVIDFVDVGFATHRWPVFNIADVAVTLGVFLLLLDYLRGSGERDEPVEVSEDRDERTEVDLGPGGPRE